MTHCRCGEALVVKSVATKVQGSVAVSMTICPKCDRRQCKDCRHFEQSGTAMACPNCGRSLA